MITVQVNTSLLKTKFQLALHENEPAKQILKEVAKKLKDNIYLNQKMFCLIPIIPKGESKPANAFTLAKYGGKSSDYMELMFNNQQSSGLFDYDSNYIDLNTIIKNLKYSTVEVTERVYVDKPMRKQKEVPIERKQDVTNTLQENNLLGKVNFNSDTYSTLPQQNNNQVNNKTSFIIGGQDSAGVQS